MTYEKNNSQNESEKNFTILPRAVWRANISTTARVVFAELASYYRGADSAIYPAYSTIAAAVGLSRRTVIRAVAELVAAGILEKQTTIREIRGGYGTNIYILRSDKIDTSRSDKIDTSRSDKIDTMNKRNLNKNINLKNLYTRARNARAKETATAAAQSAAEMERNDKDMQLLSLFLQAKGATWFEFVRISQNYYLRPRSKMALNSVTNAEYNNLINLIKEQAGSCQPLKIGQHNENEVVINV